MHAVGWMLVVVALLLALPASAARSVAVMPLVKGSAPDDYDGLGTALAGMLITDLSQVPELQLVERERLGDILAEISLGETGYLDPKTAQRLGRGVGAEMVVTGSFSVIDEALLIDTRMVAVQSGAIVKAAHATGPLADFVSVEKEVVESLIGGLEVQLSMAVRRRLLGQAPTENLDALAQYGRGVDATDEGDLDAARAAFESAVTRDPGFALAARALADLRSRVEAAQKVERERALTSREQAMEAALASLTSELARGRRFRDTIESLVDLGIRWALLQREGRWCALFQEQRHFLERTRGNAPRVVDSMPGRRHFDRFNAASKLYDARGAELGIAGAEGTYFGGRPGELIHEAVQLVSSPRMMLTFGSLSPQKFSSTLARSLGECLEPALREQTWTELVDLADKVGILDDPLYSVHGEGPSAVSVGVAMRLHRAWLRARFQGADDQVIAMTEAELARFPEGSEGRREVLSAVKDIVVQGEVHERRKAERLGLAEAVLLGLTRAVRDQAPDALNLDHPLCRAIAGELADDASRALERLAEARASQREDRTDDLGESVSPVVRLGCVKGSRPLSFAAGLGGAGDALSFRHPGTLDDASCDEDVAELAAELASDAAAPPTIERRAQRLVQVWSRVHRLRARRCLVQPQR